MKKTKTKNRDAQKKRSSHKAVELVHCTIFVSEVKSSSAWWRRSWQL